MAFLTTSLQLTSPAFADNSPVPEKYTFKGEDISPPLVIANAPYGTRSLVLMMHDPDAVNGDWLHWSLYNIPREITEIAENSVPSSTLVGQNTSGRVGYSGPHPPAGTGAHHYIFELYALTIVLDLPSGVDRLTLERQLGAGHITAQTRLTGLFTAAK